MIRDTDDLDPGDESGHATGGIRDRLLDSRRSVLRKGAAASAGLALGVPAATGTAAAAQDPLATVEFQNQVTDGTTVTVETTILEEGGYVAIHDQRLFEGDALGSVVGASDHLDPGMYRHLEIDLFDVEGAQFDRSELAENQPLVAMPHRETNDNETYDFVSSGGENDGPYTRAGQAVVDLGFVSVGATATVTFRNQRTDGTSVVVDSTELSDGGYVTIHDARLLEGDALGSVIGVRGYFDPGTHEDLEVPLYTDVRGASFEQDGLQETQPLIAMPHRETNDNETYDFVASDGANDGPYIAANQAVVDLGYAVVDSG